MVSISYGEKHQFHSTDLYVNIWLEILHDICGDIESYKLHGMPSEEID
jgi:hypothetical protein